MTTNKKILITGGSGLIGSHLCGKYTNESHIVLRLDNYMSRKGET